MADEYKPQTEDKTFTSISRNKSSKLRVTHTLGKDLLYGEKPLTNPRVTMIFEGEPLDLKFLNSWTYHHSQHRNRMVSHSEGPHFRLKLLP